MENILKEKILVSSCLLGKNVKYDGTNNCLSKILLDKLDDKYEIYSFCPEVEGGLPTPRIPCEIIAQNPLKIINKNNIDKTKEFIKGANLAFSLCKKNNIKLALLKANSPSCSSEFIYDGTFSSSKIKGLGTTTTLLQKHDIKIYDEIIFTY